MSRKDHAWVETPKGYATWCNQTNSLLTVYWHERSRGRGQVERGWRFVCSSVFSAYVYPTARTAIDAAEEEWLSDKRDRRDVLDVQPTLRDAYRRALRDQRAQQPQRGSPFSRGQQTHEEAAQRAQKTNYERAFGDIWGRRQQQAPPQQPQRPYRPAWATALDMPGDGPWTAEDVQAQYRKLAMQHHPDRGGDVATMAAINVAYETAMNFVERA